MGSRQTKRQDRDVGPILALHYTRISGADKQKDGYSLDAQLAAIRDYSAQHGWVIEAEYSDILSGRRDDRPGYQELLAHARSLRENHHQVAIVVKWRHRFGRNLLERIRAFEELDKLGVELHGAAEGGAVPAFISHFLAVMAQEETRQLGERVADMAEYITDAGWLPGRCANWGYRWRDRTDEEHALGAPRRVLDVNPDEAPYVQELFRRAAAGQSARSLHRWVVGLPLVARGGRRFPLASVQNVLCSPVYVARAGTAGAPGDDTDVLAQPTGHWPALVSDDTWRLVKEHQRLAKRRPVQATGSFLLTGLLYCMACGGRMCGAWETQSRTRRATAGPGAAQPMLRYRCFGANAGAKPDGTVSTCRRSVEGRSLDQSVIDQIGSALDALADLDTNAQAKLQRALDRRRQGDDEGARLAQRTAKRLDLELDELRAELAQAARLLVKGTLDKDGYNALKQDIDRRLSINSGARPPAGDQADTPAALPDVGALLAEVGGWSRALQSVGIPARRAVLAQLVDRVTPAQIGPGRYEASIDWTARGKLLVALATAATA